MSSPSGDASTFTFSFPYVNGAQCLAIGIAMPIVCFLMVALRLATRRVQNVRLGADDWLIINGLWAVVGMGILFIYGAAKKVTGYPTPLAPTDLTPDELNNFEDPKVLLAQKLEYPFQIFMMLAYCFIKLSIIAFYRRLFVVHSKTIFDIATKIMAAVVIAWTICFVLMIIFACGSHFSSNWGTTVQELANCPTGFTSEYGLVVSDLIIDIGIFFMPLPLIWNLRLSTSRKFAVSFIMLLGASAVGASIVRLVIYVQLLTAFTSLNPTLDSNQALAVSLWWSLLEVGLALIAACLPTLSYLFARFNLEGAIASVRSAFSLNSIRSQNSTSRNNNSTTDQPPSHGSNSTTYINLENSKSDSRSQVYAMDDAPMPKIFDSTTTHAKPGVPGVPALPN